LITNHFSFCLFIFASNIFFFIADQYQQSFDKENRKSWKGKVSKQWKKMQGSTASPLISYPEGGSIGKQNKPNQTLPSLT
jgi:hypothetical protein